MSTGSATVNAPPDLDKLTQEWLDELRNHLLAPSRFKRVFSKDVGKAFAEAYKKLRKHITDLQNYGVDVAPYQKAYDEIVSAVTKAKSEHEVEAARVMVEKLDERLIAKKKTCKENNKAFPWEELRIETLKLLNQGTEFWLPDAMANTYSMQYAELFKQGGLVTGLKDKELKTKHADTKQKFEALKEKLKQANGLGVEQKKLCDAARKATRKKLKLLNACGGPSAVALFDQEMIDAETLITNDNDYQGAKRKYLAMDLEIGVKIESAGKAKQRYEERLPKVEEALTNLAKVTSKAVCSEFDVQRLAAQRYADQGDFAKADDELNAILVDAKKRETTADKAKQAWEKNPLRAKLKQQFEAHKQNNKGKPGYYLLNGLAFQLTAIELVVESTHDYERAEVDIKQLQEEVKVRELAASNVDLEEESLDSAGRLEMLTELDKVDELLEQLEKKVPGSAGGGLHARRKQIFSDANASVVKNSNDTEMIEGLYASAALAFKQLAVDIGKVVDDDQEVTKYGQALEKERNDTQLLKAKLQELELAKSKAEQVLLKLEDSGLDAKAERSEFKTIGGREYANVEKCKLAILALNSLAVKTQQRCDGRSNEVTVKQKELVAALTKFDKVFPTVKDKLVSDDCKGFRKQLKSQRDQLEPLAKSTQLEVLTDACGTALELNRKLTETLKGGSGRQPIEALAQQLALIKPTLQTKLMKKHVPVAQSKLMEDFAAAQEGVDSGDPRAQKAIDALKIAAAQAANNADAIKISLVNLKLPMEQIKSRLTELKNGIKSLSSKLETKDVKGDLSEFKKKRDEIKSLMKGETPALYDKALANAKKLILELTAADPAALAREEKRARDRWDWLYRGVINGDEYDQASKTKDELLEKHKETCEKYASKGDYAAARTELGALQTHMRNVNAGAGKKAFKKSLPMLKGHWSKSLAAYHTSLKALVEAIKKQCEGMDDVDPNNLTSMLKEIPLILDDFKGDAFDTFIDTLSDENAEDVPLRRKMRERGLDLVRQYQRHIAEDPLLPLVTGNKFGVFLPVKSLQDVLSRLNLNFQITV